MDVKINIFSCFGECEENILDIKFLGKLTLGPALQALTYRATTTSRTRLWCQGTFNQIFSNFLRYRKHTYYAWKTEYPVHILQLVTQTQFYIVYLEVLFSDGKAEGQSGVWPQRYDAWANSLMFSILLQNGKENSYPLNSRWYFCKFSINTKVQYPTLTSLRFENHFAWILTSYKDRNVLSESLSYVAMVLGKLTAGLHRYAKKWDIMELCADI